MLKNDLENLGLNKNEVATYLALQEMGKAKAGELIKETGLHRNLIYQALDALVSRRLASKLTTGSVALFQSTDPSHLLDSVREQELTAQRVIEELKEDFDAFWKNLSKDKNLLVRDRKYLNWRYLNQSKEYLFLKVEFLGSIIGYMVIKITAEKIGYIVDLLCIEEEAIIKSLILKAINLFIKKNVKIVFWGSNKDCFYDKLFRGMGFKETLKHKIVLNIFNGNKADFNDPSKWYFTLGDTHNG